MHNHYTVLGLADNGLDTDGHSYSEYSIRDAYRTMALQYHPDKLQNNPEASERFQKLRASYDVLRDPNTRFAFDQALRSNPEVFQSEDSHLFILLPEFINDDPEEKTIVDPNPNAVMPYIPRGTDLTNLIASAKYDGCQILAWAEAQVTFAKAAFENASILSLLSLTEKFELLIIISSQLSNKEAAQFLKNKRADLLLEKVIEGNSEYCEAFNSACAKRNNISSVLLDHIPEEATAQLTTPVLLTMHAPTNLEAKEAGKEALLNRIPSMRLAELIALIDRDSYIRQAIKQRATSEQKKKLDSYFKLKNNPSLFFDSSTLKDHVLILGIDVFTLPLTFIQELPALTILLKQENFLAWFNCLLLQDKETLLYAFLFVAPRALELYQQCSKLYQDCLEIGDDDRLASQITFLNKQIKSYEEMLFLPTNLALIEHMDQEEFSRFLSSDAITKLKSKEIIAIIRGWILNYPELAQILESEDIFLNQKSPISPDIFSIILQSPCLPQLRLETQQKLVSLCCEYDVWPIIEIPIFKEGRDAAKEFKKYLNSYSWILKIDYQTCSRLLAITGFYPKLLNLVTQDIDLMLLLISHQYYKNGHSPKHPINPTWITKILISGKPEQISAFFEFAENMPDLVIEFLANNTKGYEPKLTIRILNQINISKKTFSDRYITGELLHNTTHDWTSARICELANDLQDKLAAYKELLSRLSPDNDFKNNDNELQTLITLLKKTGLNVATYNAIILQLPLPLKSAIKWIMAYVSNEFFIPKAVQELLNKEKTDSVAEEELLYQFATIAKHFITQHHSQISGAVLLKIQDAHGTALQPMLEKFKLIPRISYAKKLARVSSQIQEEKEPQFENNKATEVTPEKLIDNFNRFISQASPEVLAATFITDVEPALAALVTNSEKHAIDFLNQLAAAYSQQDTKDTLSFILLQALKGDDTAKKQLAAWLIEPAFENNIESIGICLGNLIKSKEGLLEQLHAIMNLDVFQKVMLWLLNKNGEHAVVITTKIAYQLLDNDKIAITQLERDYGANNKNNLLHHYLRGKGSSWIWPTEQGSVERNIICQLINTDRLQLTEITTFTPEHVSFLENNFSSRLYLNIVNTPLNVQALKELVPLQEALLFPLVNEGLATVNELTGIALNHLQFQMYQRVIRTADWFQHDQTRAYFQKVKEYTPFCLDIINNTVYQSIDDEIKRLQEEKPTFFSKSSQHKIQQLQSGRTAIEDLVLSKIEGLKQNITKEDWINDFNTSLVKEIRRLATQKEINGARNKTGYFFKALLGVILAACGLGIPLAFTTYTDTFFKTRTEATLGQLARSIKAPEHKASSLKT